MKRPREDTRIPPMKAVAMSGIQGTVDRVGGSKYRRAGFTLMELLVTLTITFFIFLLVYETFRSTLVTSQRTEDHLARSGTIFLALQNFRNDIITAIPETGTLKGDPEQCSFLNRADGRPYPATVTYEVSTEEDGSQTLTRTQENLLFDYRFTYPALKNIESVSFSYFDGDDWKDSWSEDEPPLAVSLTITTGGSVIEFPVRTPGIFHEEPKS